MKTRYSTLSSFRKSCEVLLLTALVPFISPGQDSSAKTISSSLQAYAKKVLQEKIYVHSDKDFYLSGERIWFSVYYVDAQSHRPIDISRIAYIEVLDNNNRPALQGMIALDSGRGKGSLQIPVTVASGSYKLRAYTNWMKNFNPGFYFEKNLTIINARRTVTAAQPPKKEDYDIQFFPEGGNLVSGLSSRVGCIAKDSHGRGVDFSGCIVDERSDTVLHFAPLKYGIGRFSFSPESGRRYTAVVSINGRHITTELPKIFDNGYVMLVNDTTNDRVVVSVTASPALANTGIRLLVHTRNTAIAEQNKPMHNGRVEFIVDRTLLKDGISVFTVFGNENLPLCERLYFKRPQKELLLNVSTEKKEYSPREKVNADLTAMGIDRQPREASLSMSVYKIDSIQNIDSLDIQTYLLLVSDLPGYIESPGYYISHSDAVAREALDNLMLTHGWRRFRWEDIMAGRIPAFSFMPEIRGHIVKGSLTDGQSSLPVAGVMAYLSAPGNRFLFAASASEKDGAVRFELNNFYGPHELIAQTDPDYDSSYSISVESPFSQKFSSKPFRNFSLPTEYSSLLAHSIGVQVENIFMAGKFTEYYPKSLDTTPFFVRPDITYMLDDYTRFGTMEEVLREYVIEVNVRKRGDRFHLQVYNEPYRAPFLTDPLVLLDGVPVFRINSLMAYDPMKVKKLDIVTRRFFYGPQVYEGIASFTTYNGNFEGFDPGSHANAIAYEGLQLEREFYAPRYQTEDARKSHVPDYRTLLHWAPAISTGSDGKKRQQFYTSDEDGTYVVVVEGMANDGSAAAAYCTFKVKGIPKSQ